MSRRIWSFVARAGAAAVLLLGAQALPIGSAVAGSSLSHDSATRSSARASLTTTQFADRLLVLTNARRKKIGCPTLRSNADLVKAARTHNNRMVRANKMSHQLPGEPSLAPRIVATGYTHWTGLAENLAWALGPNSPEEIFSMWMHSAGHRANIQHCAYHEVGFAVAFSNGDPWVTLDLGRRRGH